MKRINQSEVPIQEVSSPKGDFSIRRRHLSLALGGVKDEGPWAGGHAFDVELSTLPPGKKNWPLHAHAAQTEYYIILSGSGLVIDGEGNEMPVSAGDHFIFLPGEAHQIINNSSSDLSYYVIADHHVSDVTTYPKTGKRMLKPGNECIYPTKADYHEGEE
ncbi:MAG: cupin domain-containing protein [Verrucomicrobiota bacterium]